MSRILTVEQTVQMVQEFRESGTLRVGLTCGTFDLLHAGHVDYLEAAARECGLLLVAVNTDKSVLSYKGRLPTIPWMQRANVVSGLRAVSAVLPLEQDRPLPLLELLRPDLYIKGGDYTPGALRSADFVAEYGGEVLTVPTPWKVSSSSIKKRIIAQYQEALVLDNHR